MSTGHKAGKIGAMLLLRKTWAGILNLFVIAYLARLLSKSDFGLLSISTVFISFIEVLGSSSIGEYLIYKNSDEKNKDKIINSSFWLNMFIILMIIGVILFFAPYWAKYYHNPKIVNIVYILALGLVAQIISSIPMSILRKNLNYAPIIRIQFINGTLSQLSQLGLAFAGFGVYSLAIPMAVYPLFTGIYLMWQTKPPIKLDLGIKHWKEIFSYTRFVIGTRLIGKFTNDGDSLILGHSLGMASLGIYNVSYRLANLVNQNLLPILTDVSMPLFARYNTQKRIVLRHYLYMVRIITLFLTPMYLVLITFAPIIIRTLYGTRWLDAIVPLQLLAAFSLARSISSPTAGMYNALGKPNIAFYFNIIFTPIFLATVFIFARQSLLAVCAAVAVIRIAGSIYNIYKVGSMIDLSLGTFLNNVKHIVLPGIVLSFACYMATHFIKLASLNYIIMVLYIPMLYFVAYLLFKRSIIKDYLIFCSLFPKVREKIKLFKENRVKNKLLA